MCMSLVDVVGGACLFRCEFFIFISIQKEKPAAVKMKMRALHRLKALYF